jgi:tetratricopeptide (TPR) repeat protein
MEESVMAIRSAVFGLTLMGMLAAVFPAAAQDQQDALSKDIQALQDQWAVVKYQTPEKQQDEAFKRLTEQAERSVASYPGRAEPLVWKAIILSSHAGAVGGLGALGKVKEARRLLEQAEAIDPEALDGSVYTSLGSLYYQVPGWPVGFGNDREAEKYLKKALSINPDGIDPNYFFGDYLLEQKRYHEAAGYLEKALQAPDRPQRAVADDGRRKEARNKLAEAREHM